MKSIDRRFRSVLFAAVAGALLVSSTAAAAPDKAPTVAEAKAFVEEAEAKLMELWIEASRAGWVQATYITDDTEILAAKANERAIAAGVEYAKKATRFDKLKLPPDVARKMRLLKLGLTLAAPSNPKESEEVTRLQASMEGMYGKGKYCPTGKDKCLDLQDITKIMAEGRNAAELLDVWRGWHSVAVPMRPMYTRFVELANKGAKELGFADSGAMWRSKYDMQPDQFAKELDRLWEQVRPLYTSLHTYVRWKLREKYGAAAVPPNGPIPAHCSATFGRRIGVISTTWSRPRTPTPATISRPSSRQRKLTKRKWSVSASDSSLRSDSIRCPTPSGSARLFTKPRDREVVCHASAWDVDNVDDLRIKMCIDITDEDFSTIHHELGHNFYQRAIQQATHDVPR